jgi:hypothetical protein
MSTEQKKNAHREALRASRPSKEFCRPPESVVKSCRARMGRPIAANVSETSRQRAKASARKEFKKASLIFKFPVCRLKQSPRNAAELSASKSQPSINLSSPKFRVRTRPANWP